jgi:hypothetical protein
MYNVGFGDCFLLSDDAQNLLVDFGSDTPGVLSGIANDIENLNCGKELSVLMTHFHKDHINGFWETNLPGKVNIGNVYIPDIFAMRETLGELTFLQLHVLSDIFSSRVLNKKPVQITLYSLLKSLMNINTNIHFLNRGCTFPFASRDYKVLWPCFSKLNLHKKVEAAVLALLARIDGIRTTPRGESPSDEPIPYADSFLNLTDSFTEALLIGYGRLAQGGLQDSQIMESIDGALKIISDDIEKWEPHLPEKLIDELNAEVRSMRQQENKISIVFQDKPVDGVSSLLMTGDIPVSELKKIIFNKDISCYMEMSVKYRIIKAPHHATNSHFTNLLPSCDKILASNGHPNYSHGKWGKISYQYGSFYSSHKGCQMICSNKRCELDELNNVNNCANCSFTSNPYLDVHL